MGSRRGKSGARTNAKTRWISNIRAIRRALRRLRDGSTITSAQYRTCYRQAKGGQFHSRAHLISQMEARGDLKAQPGRRAPPPSPAKPAAPKKAKAAPPAAPPKEPKRGLLSRGKGKKEA
uniref:50S ribosomal protein L19e n=1 Tax=uncultured euryarchaeote Rifle_16ft_4_minimus_14142 TaxID=1665188 RepID=A0A0H4T0I1_9EURY|nr:50S ribosomal protein L19e [uncultured euryarchaeote Rifle_16ft_4_minimus_14142]